MYRKLCCCCCDDGDVEEGVLEKVALKIDSSAELDGGGVPYRLLLLLGLPFIEDDKPPLREVGTSNSSHMITK